MKRFVSILCLLLGFAAIAVGLYLLRGNQRREERAAAFVDAALPRLIHAPAQPEEETTPQQEGYILLDGLACLGTLEFPSLNLTLPVLAEYTDGNVELAPCRYSGTQAAGDMVIAGHNYVRHFHYVSGLEAGAQFTYTDARGEVFRYEIRSKEILDGTAVEKMIAGNWDMTLFTCTYGGKGRVALRCMMA